MSLEILYRFTMHGAVLNYIEYAKMFFSHLPCQCERAWHNETYVL